MTYQEQNRGISLPDQNPGSHQNGFRREAIGALWGQMSPAIREAMVTAGYPEEGVDNHLRGEIGRTIGLADFYRFAYDDSLGILRSVDALPDLFSMREVGSATGIQLGFFAHKPVDYSGIDHADHMVAASVPTLQGLKTLGALPDTGRYTIQKGDETTRFEEKADVAAAVLLAQYVGPQIADWIMGNGEAGVVADIMHGESLTTEDEVKSGRLPVRSGVYDGDTGVSWVLEEEPVETPFGWVVPAHIEFDEKIFDKDQLAILNFPEDSLRGRITLFKKEGKWASMQQWSYELINATAGEIREVNALRQTFNDTYRLSSFATDRQWDGNAVWAIPAYAKEKGYYCTLRVDTFNRADDFTDAISGALPLAIILRHTKEVGRLAAQGKLTEVGEGKTFATVGELFAAVGKWAANPSAFDERFRLSCPPSLAAILSSPDHFRALAKSSPR